MYVTRQEVEMIEADVIYFYELLPPTYRDSKAGDKKRKRSSVIDGG